MAIPAVSGAVTKVELAPAAALFRSLGDPTRLAILRRLAIGEARVGEQSTVSKHLACLKECGLVDSEPVGRASVFRLSQPALIDLLASAETVLQSTGQAVALCPAYGIESCAEDSDEC
jgi:DNA-binding transcriptional ArsR family regulator